MWRSKALDLFLEKLLRGMWLKPAEAQGLGVYQISAPQLLFTPFWNNCTMCSCVMKLNSRYTSLS